MSDEASTNGSSAIGFHQEQLSDYLSQISLIVPQSFVKPIYEQASLSKQGSVSIHGFPQGQTPLKYIEQNYKTELSASVQKFLLHYFVINSLYDNIRKHGIFMAGEPRLIAISSNPNQDACFSFEISTWPSITLQQWKNFPFKPPKRKNYKDIDRQVQSFIKDEYKRFKTCQEDNSLSSIQTGDWVGFDIYLVDEKKQPLYNTKENLWLRMGEEEADVSLRNCFLNKKVGDSFFCQDGALQNYFHQSSDPIYTFGVKIISIISAGYFCFNSFRHHFKLGTKKELHHKLIEVFSFRNDLSQRRTMAEEALRLLLHKHQIKIPNHFCLREQQEVLEAVRFNPDYHVYKTQPHFKDYLKTLAEKQIKESLIIDFLAHEEKITTVNEDLIAYLNLGKRPRTKEFLYFPLQNSKLNGQEVPIPAALLHRTCRREKALNHVIHHWTKK